MIHVDDIESDLANGNARGIQAAFRALVNWPDEEEIQGAKRHEFGSLLGRVAQASIENHDQMPAAIVSRLNDELRRAGSVHDATLGDYASGARLVLSLLYRWHTIFLSGEI